jgi:hypothetical protein
MTPAIWLAAPTNSWDQRIPGLTLTTHFSSIVYCFSPCGAKKQYTKMESTMLPQAKIALCVSPTRPSAVMLIVR